MSKQIASMKKIKQIAGWIFSAKRKKKEHIFYWLCLAQRCVRYGEGCYVHSENRFFGTVDVDFGLKVYCHYYGRSRTGQKWTVKVGVRSVDSFLSFYKLNILLQAARPWEGPK